MDKEISNMQTEFSNLSIDIDRISTGENLYDTIKCNLCYCISGAPLLLKCCEQIICTSCTISWKVKNHDNCPICRENNFKYSPPNRFEKNVFNQVKYFCQYKSNGCQKNDLSMEQIIPHEKKCEFNDNRIIQCEKCLQDYTKNKEHNCIDVLLNLVDKYKIEISDKKKFAKYEYVFHSLK